MLTAKPRTGARLKPLHPRGPVAFWLLNEGAGSIVHDIAGQHHGLFINNPEWAASVTGCSVFFDSYERYITGDIAPLDGDLSIVLWVKVPWNIAQHQRIFELAQASSVGLNLLMRATEVLGFDDEGGPNDDVLTTKTYADGKWHQMVVNREGTVYSLFVDSVYVGQVTNGSIPTYTRFFIGIKSDLSTTTSLRGFVDNVAIYNRSLSDFEIRRLYQDPFADILTPSYTRKVIVSGAPITLTVNPLAHSHALDAFGLIQQNILSINALLHSHWLDSSVLVLPSSGTATTFLRTITTKPRPGVRINILHPLSRGLVGLWLLNEGTGSQASDISGKGNHGTLTNMAVNSQVSGWSGGALAFDGANNNVVLAPDDDTLSGLQAVTCSCWIYTTSWSGGDAYAIVVAKSGGSSQREWRIRFETYTSLVWQISNDGNDPGAAENNISISGNLHLNTWHHIVGTYDTDNENQLNLYIDGVLKATDTGEEGPIYNGSSPFSLGASSDADGMFFGKIDQVRVYDRALNPFEVKQLYENPFAGISAHRIYCVTLGAPVSLSVAPLSHNHALDAFGLTQQNLLAIDALLHDQGVGGVGLIQQNTLAINALVHNHGLDANALVPINNFANDPHCRALWRFESGALTTDSKGSNTLTNNNTVTEDTTNFMEGACSASFDLVNDEYFNITDSNLDSMFPLKIGDTSPEFTVLFWFHLATLATNQAFYSKWTTSARSLLILFEPSNDERLSAYFGHTNGTGSERKSLAHSLEANRDYHCAVTYRDSDKSYKIRLWDNTAETVYSIAGTVTNNISIKDPDVEIGSQNGGNYGLDGRMDEAVVFDRVLLDSEIDAIRKGVYGVNSISVAGLTHSHAIDNITLITTIELVISSLLHGHNLDNIDLAQANTLAVAALSHSHDLDNVNLSQAYLLAVDALLHAQDIGSVSLTQQHVLAIAELLHTQGLDSVSLIQAHNIAINSLTHGHTIDNVTLSMAISLIVESLTHGQGVDNVGLSQAHQLAINALLHTQGLDSVFLSQAHNLSIDGLLHNHALDNVTLTMAISLVVEGLAHGQSLDNIDLTQAHQLAVNALLHAQGLDNIDLTQANILSIQSLSHGHTVDNVTLSLATILSVASLIHTHGVDNIDLTQAHQLAVDALSHNQDLDGVDLAQQNVLSIAGLIHSHDLDNVTLATAILLVIDSLLHSHALDNTDLTQAHNLIVDALTHAHSVDNINLTQAHLLSIQGLLHGHTIDNIIFGTTPTAQYRQALELIARTTSYELIKRKTDYEII